MDTPVTVGQRMSHEAPTHQTVLPVYSRHFAKRLREVYRSAGWPYQDVLEIELLAAGLLERVPDAKSVDCMRVTDLGIQYLAAAATKNKGAISSHNALVDLAAQHLLRDGRIVYKGLALRSFAKDSETDESGWRVCIPDLFSMRNSSKPDFLEPMVHEIKVSRADLLGDLKKSNKREAYLALAGQCWYVLGCNSRGKPIADVDEIPESCGVLQLNGERLALLRPAHRHSVPQLTHTVWMSLAKATPMQPEVNSDGTL